MKTLNLTMLAGLCFVAAMLTPCANAEKFDWMPAEIDQEGLNSEDLGGEQIIPDIIITKTPKPTADMSKFTKEYVIELEKFNISNDGTNPVETSKGINEALQHAKTLGANRIVFPKGKYLISKADPIVLDHKNTIVDLGGSTLKIEPKGGRYTMVQIIDGAENFRLTNGTLLGDRDTRKRAGGGKLLQFVSGRNLEADNMTFTKSPGFCVGSGATGNRTRPELLAMIMHSVYLDDLEQGAFSETGKKIASTEKTRTIKPYDATKCKGEFEFGRGGIGYQGYPFIKGRVFQTYFYDKDMKFIKMTKYLQYKKIAVPKNAEFMHLEFNQPKVTGKPKEKAGRITNFKPPTDVHFHDNHIVENRGLGMAYCGGQQWLIEDCIFEKNGPDIVGWGFDFEDGWELMQNAVLRNNLFKNNLKGDLVVCAGSELLFEGNTFTGSLNIYGRPHNYIIRNNKFTGGRVGYSTRTGIAKIHNNTYENCNVSITFDTKAVADGLYRKPGQTVVTPPLTLENETMTNVKEITGTYFNIKNSKLTNANFVAGERTSMVNLENCQLDSVSLEYETEGPEVHVKLKDCKGELKEQGPGLKRKKQN